MNEYDRAQTLASALRAAFVAALNAARQYAIRTDPASVEEFRSQLAAIVRQVEQSMNDLDESRLDSHSTAIHDALRIYHDRAQRYIEDLHSSLTATSDVLRVMVEALQSGDSDAEKDLKSEIVRLRSVDKLTNLEEVRAYVRKSVESLASCADQLRREKDVVIAQLRDEIRTLQNSMEESARAAAMDPATGTYQRKDFERLIQREIVRGQAVTVIRLWLKNIQTLAACNPIDQILAAFCKRAHEVVSAEAMGRWQENVFCVLLPSAAAKAAAAALAQKCAGIYAYMDGDAPRTLHLQLAVASLTCPAGGDVEAFVKKIDALA